MHGRLKVRGGRIQGVQGVREGRVVERDSSMGRERKSKHRLANRERKGERCGKVRMVLNNHEGKGCSITR